MYSYSIMRAGNVLQLTGQQQKWQLRSVSGLNPPKASIYESTLIGVPGVKKTGSRIEKRNIVFNIHINHPCEINREELLRFFSTDMEIDIQIDTPRKNLTIKGTVEACEYAIYSRAQEMQVSVLCDYPYFKSSEDRVTTYAKFNGGFKFPLNLDIDETTRFDEIELLDRYVLYNYGQIETGLKIEVILTKHTPQITILNADNENEFFQLAGAFYAGDKIYIDTNPTATEKVILERNGVREKILKRLVPGVTWFKLKDVLVLRVATQNCYLNITNHDEVAGV